MGDKPKAPKSGWLGSGLAAAAGSKLKNRGSRIDRAVNSATGKADKDPKSGKGTGKADK